MIKQTKYFQNLQVVNNNIYSYNALVATIDHEAQAVELVRWRVHGRSSSPTTSRHINYVARLLEYKVQTN
jgi:hypothetical protein